MHQNHDTFIAAVKSKKKLHLTFRSQQDNKEIDICCAPMDYHPGRRAGDESDLYFFWCSDTDLYNFRVERKNLILKLHPSQIIAMEMTDRKFNPARFVGTGINWYIPPRNWRFSCPVRMLKKGIRYLKSAKKKPDRRSRT